jgi:hypothetical protein
MSPLFKPAYGLEEEAVVDVREGEAVDLELGQAASHELLLHAVFIETERRRGVSIPFVASRSG